MDQHKELFKNNWTIGSPLNHRVVNRRLQQANRAEKRKNLYHEARNLPLTPKHDAFQFIAASSTPMPKNTGRMEIESDKENNISAKEQPIKEEAESSVPIKRNTELKKEEKLARREAHIQRFLAWKAQKIQQKEQEKQKFKPPFIPVGKPKPISQVAVEQSSFAPKDHLFHPPAGLREPTVEAVKRQSIYFSVSTPKPKQNKRNQKGTDESNSKSKTARNVWINKNSVAIKSLTIPQQKEQTADGNAMKLTSGSAVKRANGTVHKNIKSLQETEFSKCNTYPNQELPTTSKKALQKASGNVVKIANGTVPRELVKKINSNINDLKETESSNLNNYPKQEIPTTSKNALQNGTVSTQKKEVAVKCVSTRRMEPPKKSLKAEIKNNKPSSQNVPISSLVKGQSTGAVGKARAMQDRKQNIKVQPQVQNQRNKPKPKLSANLKVKKPTKVGTKLTKIKCLNGLNANTVPTETPVDTGNSENLVAFVTSTQLKTASTSALQNSTLSNLCKSISPVEVRAKNRPAQNVSAKRCLLQDEVKEKMTTKTRKFKFVREVLLDMTSVDSPVVMPTPKEAAIQQKIVESEKKEDNPSLQPPQNRKNKSKLHNRIFQKMQLHLDEKATNIKSPLKIKSTPRKSLKPESNHAQKTSQGNKKFNFLVQLKLDETAVESNDAEDVLPKAKVENENAKQKTNTPETVAPASKSEQPETPKGRGSTTIHPLNYMSPFVSVSRGKVSARKEKEKRNSIYLQETPTKAATPIKIVETPIEKRRALEAVRYFRQQLQDEIQRLNALCSQWDAYKEKQLDLLQENNGEDMINVTTGQTRLLTSKKFMQFNGLINRCEAHVNGIALANDGSEATKTITAEDLEGFWSMLTLQVENVEKRFQNLERLKHNNWQDLDAVELKPRIVNNLKKVKKSKTTMAGAITKPRENTALRQMMRNKIAEMRAKNKEGKSQEIHVLTKEKISTPSPRRLRYSTISNDLKINNLSPGRICLVVPDRKSHSLARTVISVPSPSRTSANKVHDSSRNDNLLRTTLQRCTRRSRSSQARINLQTPSPITSDPINSPPRTPMPTTARKSILKTPGTATNKLRNVVFNNHLSVKKFRPLKYDEDHHMIDVEYDDVLEVHIDDFDKMKQAPELSPNQKLDDCDTSVRSYSLRNRRVKLRPSCEIELPK